MMEIYYDTNFYDFDLSDRVDDICKANLKNNIDPSDYVVESFSDLLKELIKKRRGFENDEDMIKSAHRMLASILVLLQHHSQTIKQIRFGLFEELDEYLESI